MTFIMKVTIPFTYSAFFFPRTAPIAVAIIAVPGLWITPRVTPRFTIDFLFFVITCSFVFVKDYFIKNKTGNSNLVRQNGYIANE